MSNPRVISGKVRGFRLRSVPGDITRPVTDRVKGAVFNIIGPDIQDSSWLDLFGGTGSVGIEALSRGAGFARFIDLNRAAVDTIKQNLAFTHLEDLSQVLQADAFSILKSRPDRSFDYVYIAPPQYRNMWGLALQGLDQNPDWLSPDAWVIVQIDPVEIIAVELKNLVEFDRRRYGSTLVLFFQKK